MGGYPFPGMLFHIIRTITYYPTRNHTYRTVTLTASVILAAWIFLKTEVAASPSVKNSLGFSVFNGLGSTAYLLWAEGSFPDHWRRVRDEVHVANNGENLPSNFPWMKKLRWMLDLAHNPRMVGWVQEPHHRFPPHPPPSRRKFLWRTLLTLIINAVLLDLLTFVFSHNPAFDSRVHNPTDGPETYLAAVPLLRRVPYVLAYGLWISAGFILTYSAVALPLVGFCITSPTLWPDIWGSWGDAFTLRRLWGRTWQQTLRPMFVGLGRLVGNKFLGFPRGTNGSAYVQLHIAFLLSGLAHLAGEWMYEERMIYRSMTFFPLQAVAITFEDLFIHTTNRLLLMGGIKLEPGKPNESWADVVVRALGYCWVALWFCLTLPIYIDGASATGLYITDRGRITRFLLGV